MIRYESRCESCNRLTRLSQLCRLLEADLSETRSNFESREPAPDVNPAGAVLDVTSNDYMQQRRRSFVSYGVFLEAYWAHFPQQWTKGLGIVYRDIRKGFVTQ